MFNAWSDLSRFLGTNTLPASQRRGPGLSDDTLEGGLSLNRGKQAQILGADLKTGRRK